MGKRVELDDGVGLYCREAGTGAIPVVFVTGLAMSGEVFDRQLAHLAAARRYRAIAFDPRGQGSSDKPAQGYTHEQQARDLQALIRALELHRPVLAGWSFGVLTQLAYLEAVGAGAVRALVLIDGTPRTSARNVSREWAWYRRDDADARREWHTLTALHDPLRFRHQFAQWMLESPSPAAVAEIEAMLAPTPPFVTALLNETGAYLDFREVLADAARRLPLLVVVRADRELQARAWCERHAPAARVEAFGAHLMFRERADEFNALLDEFLGALD